MLENIQPAALWRHFEQLNAIPRASKKEQRVIEFMRNFGNSLHLSTTVDEAGNVMIKKPATPGLEDRPVICLQSHLDMVHQKNAGTQFDFEKEGIKMLVDGDWVRARGTTLGADNGIGVAAIMSVLSSKEIAHPAIEALFTIDEETGMTGAMALKGGLLKAKYLLNLDTEDDHELTIGCAGGIDVTATRPYDSEPVPDEHSAYAIKVSGLTGGHSGMDIHLGRGNANKLLNRLLATAQDRYNVRLCSFDGGSLRNAIPREATADVLVPCASEDDFRNFVDEYKEVIKEEYRTTDPQLTVSVERIAMPGSVINSDFQEELLRCMYACPNGIYRMSPDIDQLVQSSNNLARVLVKDGTLTVMCLTRSSVDSEKMDLANAVRSSFELCNASVSLTGAYPGWTPKLQSEIVRQMETLYKNMYGNEAHVNAVHAGLECGILGTNYPATQMISFGPNIRGAHSPDECVQISSVQKFWQYLLEALLHLQ